MAYINVAEWSPEQVTDWLKGLDDVMEKYVDSFSNNHICGKKLLNIRPYELEQLNMISIGHQEIVLEAVENLRNFNYHLDKENLQFLALHIATTAKNLFRLLSHHCAASRLETRILNDISHTINAIKPLTGWLDRSPFRGHRQFFEIRKQMLRLGIELATSAQRDQFVENPVDQIRTLVNVLANLADYIIQDITDPMLLQPATLALVTLKKSELGFVIMPSYYGTLDIKYNSPPFTSGKIEDSDEIVQINYQTVIGWQYMKVIAQLQLTSDIVLTLKKRPKHIKIYGQIYMKPYRLPSKKRTLPYLWSETVSYPYTRTEMLMPLQEFFKPLARGVEKRRTTSASSDSSDSENSFVMTPTDANAKTSVVEKRLYLPKPRAVLQRRNTVHGDQLSGFKNIGSMTIWSQQVSQSGQPDSPSLRDKSVSFGFGLEWAPRPATCLAAIPGSGGAKFLGFPSVGAKGSLPEITAIEKLEEKLNAATKVLDKSSSSSNSNKNSSSSSSSSSKPGISKLVRFDSNMKLREYHVDNKFSCNVENTVLETFEPIPYVDEDVISVQQASVAPPAMVELESATAETTGLVQAVNLVLLANSVDDITSAKHDKGFTLPFYDDSADDDDDDDSDVPPAIEPRKEHLQQTPPAPPPRPRKSFESTTSNLSVRSVESSPEVGLGVDQSAELRTNRYGGTPPPPLTPVATTAAASASASAFFQNKYFVRQSSSKDAATPDVTLVRNSLSKKVPTTKHFLEEKFESLELLTPHKTKNLTLKKKNSILAKRRKISLKTLSVTDIQGHLFRRSKDKQGVTYWAKLYFVLVDTALYGFRSKEAPKADCLVFLSGFTVSVAIEVHSKAFAFKVYRPSKTFYFAAETQEAMAQWMQYLEQATIKKPSTGTTNVAHPDLFTETESSADESTASSQSSFIQKVTNAAGTGGGVGGSETKSEKYHLGFGSLKKFTKSNLPFSSHRSGNNEKKAVSSDVPVPTAQFRSYRKVPGNAGIQLGTNSMFHVQLTPPQPLPPPPPPASQPPQFEAPPPPFPLPLSLPLPLPLQLTLSPPLDEEPGDNAPSLDHFATLTFQRSSKSRKKSPYNYIHASNPNLVDFDFHTAKSVECSLPKINAGNSWDGHANLVGSVTLKDLMLQKQAEEAREVYNNRVYLGMEKKDDGGGGGGVAGGAGRKKPHSMSRTEPAESVGNGSGSGNGSGGVRKLDKIQSRSLPKTPDYAQSFKPDDQDIIMTRSKEGQKLRDFGYELITGDANANANVNVNPSQSSHQPETVQQFYRVDRIGPIKGKARSLGNWIQSNSAAIISGDENRSGSRQGSIKKAKIKTGSGGAIVSLGTAIRSVDRNFHVKQNVCGADKEASSASKSGGPLKPSISYSPMTLPLQHKKVYPGGSSAAAAAAMAATPVWSTVDSKISPSDKGSSASYFTKLSFSNTKTAKEKKLLGSPLLHRTLFGRTSNALDSPAEIDHEIFSPITFGKMNAHSVDGGLGSFSSISSSQATMRGSECSMENAGSDSESQAMGEHVMRKPTISK